MPETIDFPGRFYLHGFRYPETNGTPPRIEEANTKEVEPPYRRGKGRVVRFGRFWGLVVGRWGRAEHHEDETLMEAMEGEVLPYTADEIGDW